MSQQTKEVCVQYCLEKKENEQLKEIKATLSSEIVELNQRIDSYEQLISKSLRETEDLQKSMESLTKEKLSLIQTNSNLASTVSI